jgi:hypothetical protein
MMIAVALGGLMLVSASEAKADHFRGRGGSNFGISINYGSGFNNFGGGYGRGYGYGGRGFGYGNAYPVYRTRSVYAVPVYSVPVYGGYYGGGYGGRRHCH